MEILLCKVKYKRRWLFWNSHHNFRKNFYEFYITVKILKICTPEKVAVIILKFEHHGFTIEKCVKMYRKSPKHSDTQKICCHYSKNWTMWLYHRVMSPNDADGRANSVDPDQTAPLFA